jgi:hypothetical protein
MEEKRIAMWAAPRTLSTVMLRAWESRTDTAISDEPFYGYFLAATGADRPGRDSALEVQAHDWRTVLDELAGAIPDGKTIWFQKHHAMHLLPEVPRTWILGVMNFFLIRDPVLSAISYSRIRPTFTTEDLGIRQSRMIFEFVSQHSASTPIVLNASDLARNPRKCLEGLCAALDVCFTEDMLTWSAGEHPADAPLGDPWYQRVQETNSFVPYQDHEIDVPEGLRHIVNECLPDFDVMNQHRLQF